MRTPDGQPASGAVPRIVATSPAVGATDVDPATAEITVTFDRDMGSGFSWTGSGPDHPPTPEEQHPFWRDRRTCVLPVKLEAGHHYRVGINSTSYQNFRSSEGVPASPSAISFVTKGASEEVKSRSRKPQVVSMNPPNGANDVDPALRELRVTFNVSMGGGFSWTGGGPHYPKTAGRPHWTKDRKTCVLPVQLKPGWDYRLGLNSPSFKNFQSEAGIPLEPVEYVFTTRGAGADEATSPQQAAPEGGDSKVVEGIGWGGFRVGATREELIKAFGPLEPTPTPGSQWMGWVSRHHVDCWFDQAGRASEVRFNKGFSLPLTSGIKIGSSEKEVLWAYGSPDRVVNKPQSKMLAYDKRGVLMWVMGGKVLDFTVFRPVALQQAGTNEEPAKEVATENATKDGSAPETKNILTNPGAEDGEKAPDGWEQTVVPPGPAIAGVKYLWDKKVAFEGKASLGFEKTANRYFPIAQWSQTVERKGDARVLEVSAQVKAQKMTKAIVDVLFLDKDDQWISHEWAAYIGSKEDGDPPANHNWKKYSGKVKIPEGTAKICIGLQDYGPGKVWFDDVRASYVK